MIKFGIHEILFLLAGLSILLSTFFIKGIEGFGFYLWSLAKILYFTGIIFFIIHIIKDVRN